MAMLGAQAETWQCLEGVKHRLRTGSASRGWSKPQARARKLSKRKVRIRKKSPLEPSWPSFETSDLSPPARCHSSKTEDQKLLIKEAITSNPTFGPMVADFSARAMLALVDSACSVSFSPGQTIVKQGDCATSVWIVREGEVEILVDGKRETIVTPRMCFGEFNCLNVPTRTISVVALGEVLLWELKRDYIIAMHAEPLRAKLASHTTALARTPFFENRSERFVQRVADALIEQTIKTGDYIFRQHDEADAAYLLLDGSLILEIDGIEVSRLRANPTTGVAPSFGSNALTELRIARKRSMSARVASVKADILVLDRQLFLQVLRATEDSSFTGVTARRRWNRLRAYAREFVRKRYEVHKEILAHAEHFHMLPAEVRNKLALGARKSIFLRDEYVFREGEEADTCYVMLRGLVSVVIDGVEMSRMEADVGASKTPVFGIQSLSGDCQRKASICVMSQCLEVLVITRGCYQEVANASLLSSPSQSFLGLKSFDGLLIQYRPEDLVELGLLGKGGFGTVTLVKHKPTEYLFALKAVSKGYMMAQNMQDCIMNERNVLRMVNSPFLTRAVAFFNSPQRLLLLTELALGGELYDVCERNKLFGKKEECRFYLACVIAALEHLHSRHIMYRGLKSENVLLDDNGYAKLKDFGFAKVTLGRTTTVCGTPHYFAPELIMGVPYNVAVDWWALGVLLFELNTGKTPFEAEEPHRMYTKIACGIEAVVFPSRSEIWPDLVMNLCAKRPSDRLPMRSGGARRLRSHQYYAKTRDSEEAFDWTAFYSRDMKPPFLPETRSCEETRNFPQDVVTDPQPMESSIWRPVDQWAQFEERWGPAIWEDPEEDPRSSKASSTSQAATVRAPRIRRSIFPPPPQLKAPEWEFTSSTVDSEISRGTDEEDPGISRVMPKTSPRVQMPVSLGDVDEPDGSILEPEPEEGVSDDDVMDDVEEDCPRVAEKADDSKKDDDKISPMERFSRRVSPSAADSSGECTSDTRSFDEKDVNDCIGEKLVYEPNQADSLARGQRSQVPFITSAFADLKKCMSLKLSSESVDRASPSDRLVFAPKAELLSTGNKDVPVSEFIYKPSSQDSVEDLSREHSGLVFEEDLPQRREFESAASPMTPSRSLESTKVERKVSSRGFDFTAFKEAMSSRLQAVANASVPSLGGVLSEGGSSHVFDAPHSSEQATSREQSASVRNPFITPTGSINERYCNKNPSVPQSPAVRTRSTNCSTSGLTASPMPTYRELRHSHVNTTCGATPQTGGLERSSPMMSSRVIKFPFVPSTSCPSSPQFKSRTLKPPTDPGTPAGYNTARPPNMRPSGGMVHSPTLRSRIIGPDTSESMLSTRTLKHAPLTPAGNEPKSPLVRNRSITTEHSAPIIGTRGLREPPSAARSMQANIFANSKPTTLAHMSSSGASGLQSQPSTMRILRGPRHSKPYPSSQQSAPTNAPQQHGGTLGTQSQHQRLTSNASQQSGCLMASSQQQSQTPLLRTRSPLRSPAVSHRNVSSTPLQFPRSPGTPQTLFSRNLRLPPSQAGDMTAAAIIAGLGHATPRNTGML